MITYAQARTAADALTHEATILAALGAAGVSATGYDDMSVTKALVVDAAQARAAEQLIRAELAGALDPSILVTMDEAWVDVILLGAYQERRLPAVAARGTLRVAVAGGATYGAGSLLVQDVSTGRYFRNTNAAAVTILAGESAVLPFEAVAIGSAGNPAGGAWTLTSGPAGATIGVTVDTWTRTRAGADAEDNLSYWLRCSAKWGSLGAGGSIDAYNYRIPTALGAGFRWRIRDDNPGGPGTIWVIVADAAGPASPEELTTLDAYLQPRRALGSGALSCFAAAADALTLTLEVELDGTRPTACADLASLLAQLGVLFPVGPAVLDPDLVRGIALGGLYATVDIEDGAGGVRRVQPARGGLGAYGGLGISRVVSCSLSSPHAVPLGGVLVLDPIVTVAP